MERRKDSEKRPNPSRPNHHGGTESQRDGLLRSFSEEQATSRARNVGEETPRVLGSHRSLPPIREYPLNRSSQQVKASNVKNDSIETKSNSRNESASHQNRDRSGQKEGTEQKREKRPSSSSYGPVVFFSCLPGPLDKNNLQNMCSKHGVVQKIIFPPSIQARALVVFRTPQ